MVVFFAHPGWHVDRVARGESSAAWRAALECFDTGAAVTLKEDSGGTVYAASVLGREVVLKRWDLASLGARAKAIVRAGRADRHWRNAAWLGRSGIPTARCLAVATEYRRGGPRRWLVMEAVPGKTLLEHLAKRDLGVRDEAALAWAVGLQLAMFGASGRWNRDHKPSNLIVAWTDGGVRVSVIDCVAIQRGEHVDRMLASLVIEPIGCGVAPRRALAWRVVRGYHEALTNVLGGRLSPERRRAQRERCKETWRRVTMLVRAHGDPRSRVDPLAGPAALKSAR